MASPDNNEHFHLSGDELVDKVKELIHEGNVNHIRIRHDEHVILDIPVTVGVAGGLAAVIVAPLLAAVAALGAALTHCTLEVVRTEPPTNL
jgi:hypothetical protein